MKLHTGLPLRQCISKLEHNTDSARCFTLMPDKTYVLKVSENRFCIWRVSDSAMPRNMEICSPAFCGRFIDNGRDGTTIVGRFQLRMLARALLTVVMLPLVILLVIAVRSPPPASFWTDCEPRGMSGIGLAIGVGLLTIWFVMAWRRDSAMLTEFLVLILDAKRI